MWEEQKPQCSLGSTYLPLFTRAREHQSSLSCRCMLGAPFNNPAKNFVYICISSWLYRRNDKLSLAHNLQAFLSEKKHLVAPRANTPYSDSDLAFSNCMTPSIIPANCTPATNADTPLIYPNNSLPFQLNAYKTNAWMFIIALTLTAAENHIRRTGSVPSRSNGITVE